MSFQLEPGQLAFCQGHWDPKKNKYTQDNSIDVLSCCIHSCTDYISDCFDNCHNTYGPDSTNPSYKNHKKCHSQCQQLIQNCENVCMSYPSEGMDNIAFCSKQHGCDQADKKCLSENKDKIMSCCRKRCQYGDCDSECQDSWNHEINKPLKNIAKKFNIDEAKFKNYSHDNYIYIFYFIAVVLAILGVYIIAK